MTTYNITSNLLDTVARNNAIIAMNNSNSAPAPAWAVYLVIGIAVVGVLFCAGLVLHDVWDDIEFYFWQKKKFKKK